MGLRLPDRPVSYTHLDVYKRQIGDTVKFTRKNPYKFVITGRTKHFINAFGEELIVDNAEKGLAKACACLLYTSIKSESDYRR